MNVRELIEKLSKIDSNKTVYLDDGSDYYDFSGLSYDDNNDVQLYIVGGDEKA